MTLLGPLHGQVPVRLAQADPFRLLAPQYGLDDVRRKGNQAEDPANVGAIDADGVGRILDACVPAGFGLLPASHGGFAGQAGAWYGGSS